MTPETETIIQPTQETGLPNQIAFIRKHFSWDHPSLPAVISKLSLTNITLDDLGKMLGVGEEEIRKELYARPQLKEAYETGPQIADAQVAFEQYKRAMAGDSGAQQFWLRNKLSTKKPIPPCTPIKADTVEELWEKNIPLLIERGFALALQEDDLTKVTAFANTAMDRFFGKPHASVDVNATVRYEGLKKILDAIDGTTAGLPSDDQIRYSMPVLDAQLVQPETERTH